MHTREERRALAERESVYEDRIKSYEEAHNFNDDFIIVTYPSKEQLEQAKLEEAYELK